MWLTPVANAADIELRLEGHLDPTEENAAFLKNIGATSLTWTLTATGELITDSFTNRYVLQSASITGSFGGLEARPPSIFSVGVADIGSVFGDLSDLAFVFGFVEGIDFELATNLVLGNGSEAFVRWKGFALTPNGTLAATPSGEPITDFEALNLFELQNAFNDTLATGELTSMTVTFIPGVGPATAIALGGIVLGPRRRRGISRRAASRA